MNLVAMYGRITVRPIVDTATTNGIAISPQKNNGDNGVSTPLSPFCICHCGKVGARAIPFDDHILNRLDCCRYEIPTLET
jgi:hypothetical protein